MRARGLNKKVYIWQTKTISDGFSSETVYNELITSSWAKVETAKSTAGDLNNIGLENNSINLMITVRYRNDIEYSGINQFISYAGVNYMFVQSPNELDLNRTFVKLIATRVKDNNIEELSPINPDSNTIFINYKNRVIANNGVFEAEECTREFINTL